MPVANPFQNATKVSSSTPFRQLGGKASESMTPLAGKSVLIIDQNAVSRRTLQEQMSILGAASIRFAITPADVFRAIQAVMPDLIICEYQLDDFRTGQQLLEELKIEKKLPWTTGFIMVTGERRYGNVIGVVELEPDDYLIKPFTPSQLSDRVVRLFQKKNVLAPVMKALNNKDFLGVVEIITELEPQHPVFASDFTKLKVQAWMDAGQFDNAEVLLRKMLDTQPAPWMNMVLAKIHCKKSQWEAAREELGKVTRAKPEFLAAKDMLADVLWELNQPEGALQILEDMGSSALENSQRLRKMADLSLRVQNQEKAKDYLNRVINRTQSSSMARVDDYLNLIGIFVEEGNTQAVSQLESKMKQTIGAEGLEVGRLMVSLKQAIKDQDVDRARMLLEQGIKLTETAEKMPSETVHINLVEACFDLGKNQTGYSQARMLASRGVGKAILDRIKRALGKAK